MSSIVIIDYGSQVTQLIARRIREAGVYSEICPCTVSADYVQSRHPSALILSGGPASVGEKDAPEFDIALLDLKIPILGICYGMQLLAQSLGGELAQSTTREYGHADFVCKPASPLWHGLNTEKAMRVWMSHGDTVKCPPPGFSIIGSTQNLQIAAMADEKRQIYAVQFHPEVHHTEYGIQILRNFVFCIAKATADWTMSSFIDRTISETRAKIGADHCLCALSGGVDSTVAAILLHRAIGKKLHCIFVDNGVLRAGENHEVVDYLRSNFDLNLTFVQAGEKFLQRLKGIDDPEQKRKIIGHTFIEIFEEQADIISHDCNNVKWLAQGTLYPDVIESISFKGPSAVIKSHHNVGGLPKNLKLQLVEPLRELFKDEVRQVATELNMPESIIWRHPFPGPGLAIRILGEVTEKRLEILRRADQIVQQELRTSGWYRKIWQGFAVLLPLRTVGVMGDSRTYEHVIAIRCVDSVDAMTADWSRLPADVLEKISGRIINEVRGVNRVVYDISSKPPSTIEWE